MLRSVRALRNIRAIRRVRVLRNIRAIRRVRALRNIRAIRRVRVFLNIRAIRRVRVFRNIRAIRRVRALRNIRAIRRVRALRNIRAIVKPNTEQDDHHLLSREKHVVLVRLRTGQNRPNAHNKNRKFKLVPSQPANVAEKTRQRNTFSRRSDSMSGRPQLR